MYKLTVISGPNRGSSYVLKDGELSVGRQTGNTIVLPSSKVSKRHCVFVLSNGEVTVQDQGSSNGTFVNGVLTKIKKIKPGDRISVGEFVFELVLPPKRVQQAAPAVAGLGNVVHLPIGGVPRPGGSQLGMGLPGMSTSASTLNQPPKDLKGKLLWILDHRLMPIFYGMSLKYEWRMMLVGLLTAMVIGNLIISINPLLDLNHDTVVKESKIRAQYMAKEISERNSPMLAARAETRTEIGTVENAYGVKLAVLVDLDNRIIAPSSKMNQSLSNGVEASTATIARQKFRSGFEQGLTFVPDDSTVVAIEPVKVMSPAAGKNVIVAMAIVSVDTTLSSPDMGGIGVIYSQSFIITGILAIIIGFILYKVTLKPFQVLNEDMDKALKGDISQVTHEFKLEELDPLWAIINSAVQRIPKSNSPGGGGAINGLDSSSGGSEEVVGPIKMMGGIIKFGLVAFDGDQKIIYLNPMFEEISGIRADGAIGREIGDVARDQALGPFTSDLLGRASPGGEGVNEDFDFSGISYKMYASVFGSPGQPAKGYLLAAVRVTD